ncbi:MAG: hypothetical protein Ct9H300mP8_01590 [Gammaproteobacteria bacterium]|nr:MAG: hypothetical protein Ct9H300mP8_01590 [Gammaproteobacteria bacterium]
MSDVGTVALVDREIDHLVRVNSIEGVGLAITRGPGANTVEVSRTVRDPVVGLAQDLPNVTLTEVSDDASLVVAALDDLETAAGAGILLAIAVLAFFLRSIGATLVVSAAVPVSTLCRPLSDAFWIAKSQRHYARGVSAWCGHAGGQCHRCGREHLPTIDGGRDEGRSRGDGNRTSRRRDYGVDVNDLRGVYTGTFCRRPRGASY